MQEIIAVAGLFVILGEARQAAGKLTDIGKKFAGWQRSHRASGQMNEADALADTLNGRRLGLRTTGKNINVHAITAKLTCQSTNIHIHATSVACAAQWSEW